MEDYSIIDKAIRRVPNFPKPGILFYDITGLLATPKAFDFCVQKMIQIYENQKIDAIAAVESRGFIFASPLSVALKLPLILIRKKGKLPGETYSQKCTLEYGTAEIEIHKSDVQKGQKILVVDDLVATGGTLVATKALFQKAAAEVIGFFGVIGLPQLGYKELLSPIPVTTFIEYCGK